MCSRFYSLSKEEWKNILQDRYDDDLEILHNAKDIYPSNEYYVLTKDGFEMMSWGFSVAWSKQLLINARVESVREKPTFKKDFATNRCLIFVKGFYEWDKTKNKYYVKNNEDRVMAIAGFYQNYENTKQFIIMTQDATKGFKIIHDRLPCIVEKGSFQEYLTNENFDLYKLEIPLIKLNWKMMPKSI